MLVSAKGTFIVALIFLHFGCIVLEAWKPYIELHFRRHWQFLRADSVRYKEELIKLFSLSDKDIDIHPNNLFKDINEKREAIATVCSISSCFKGTKNDSSQRWPDAMVSIEPQNDLGERQISFTDIPTVWTAVDSGLEEKILNEWNDSRRVQTHFRSMEHPGSFVKHIFLR